jgi:hypothetical protein
MGLPVVGPEGLVGVLGIGPEAAAELAALGDHVSRP